MSEETKYILNSYILDVLYPKEKYPRHLFPFLEKIIPTSHSYNIKWQ